MNINMLNLKCLLVLNETETMIPIVILHVVLWLVLSKLIRYSLKLLSRVALTL